LGIEHSHDAGHKIEKDKFTKEYSRRMRLVFGMELSAKNKIQAIQAHPLSEDPS